MPCFIFISIIIKINLFLYFNFVLHAFSVLVSIWICRNSVKSLQSFIIITSQCNLTNFLIYTLCASLLNICCDFKIISLFNVTCLRKKFQAKTFKQKFHCLMSLFCFFSFFSFFFLPYTLSKSMFLV